MFNAFESRGRGLKRIERAAGSRAKRYGIMPFFLAPSPVILSNMSYKAQETLNKNPQALVWKSKPPACGIQETGF
jgi:hypothetical protein